MLGRGLIADPALLRPEKRTRERLQAFDEALLRGLPYDVRQRPQRNHADERGVVLSYSSL